MLMCTNVVILIVSNFLTCLLLEPSGQQQTSKHERNDNAPPANSGRDVTSPPRHEINPVYEPFEPKPQ